MKKYILIIAIIMQGMLATAQEYIAYDTVQITVRKHQIAEQELSKLVVTLEKETSREKGSGEILYKDETQAFVNAISKAFKEYSNALIRVDTLVYSKVKNDYFLNGDTAQTGVAAEFFKLQSEIKAIDQDEEIKYKDAVSGIQARREKQEHLKGIFTQLNKKEEKSQK